MKGETPGEQQQQQPDLLGNQTDAKFVFNLEKCVYFSCQTGSWKKGVPTRIIVKKQYHSTMAAGWGEGAKRGNPAVRGDHTYAHC